jgi:hypothetical protein
MMPAVIVSFDAVFTDEGIGFARTPVSSALSSFPYKTAAVAAF